MQWKVKVCIGPWLKIAFDFIWLLMGSSWTDILCVYVYILYVYDICTYFDCWFFILMCLSHGDVPSSLSEMEPKIPLSLLSHILASNSQTNRASISMGLFSIFNHLGKLQKKILNLNYILGCPKEVSKWVITYNLLINGVFLGVITHWSDHLWSWLPTGHPSKGARWNWGRENSLTKTPVESMEKPPSSRTVDHPIIDPRPTLRTGQHMPLRILPNWCQDGMNMAPNH